MYWILIGLAIAIICPLLWHALFIIKAKSVPQEPNIVHLSAGSPIESAIPKIIWAYWQQTPPSYFVNGCINNWRFFAYDHEIRFINPSTLNIWLDKDSIPSIFDTLPAYRKADWIRLQLLKKYGGIWIDASTLLTQDLKWLHDIQKNNKSEYVGFYFNGFTAHKDQPIVENWFMAATPNSSFIIDLCTEFNRAILSGEKSYLLALKKENKFDQVIQHIEPKLQEYLIMHVAAAVVLNKEPHKYQLTLMCAEESALSFQTALDSRRHHLYVKLALFPCPKNLPKLVKLRGNERKIFERHLARKLLYPKSFLATYLKPRLD